MSEGPTADVTQEREAALIGIAEELARELSLHPRPGRRGALRMSLERDWGFDSLSRVERAFSVNLPTHLLQEAETLEDVLSALARVAAAPAAKAAGLRVPAQPAV